MRTICVKAEEKNAKQNNDSKYCLPSENAKTFWKKVVGVACVACIVSCHFPLFMVFGIMQGYCRRLLVLPDTSMYTTFS